MVRGRQWTGFEAAALQEAMRKSVREFAALLGIETTTITNWRTGLASVKPRSGTQAILDTTLELRATPEDRSRFEQIVAEGEAVWRARHGRSADSTHPAPSADLLPEIIDRTVIEPLTSAVNLDSDYVESLHERINQLVELDVTFGGDQSAEFALRLFRSVHRKIGAAHCDSAVERDLYAAAGELGEVAGWLLYDAGRHEQVRRVNNEALQLSRLAGDRRVELLTLQNMSMHAEHLGRPVEALRIARMVLEQRSLSPRLETMFRIRESRALASTGDEQSAIRAFTKARSLYLDGTRYNDPPWVWWINDQELDWQEATILADRGEWADAVDTFHTSAAAIPVREVRSRYYHLASLFHAQARANAWPDAGDTIDQIVPFTDEIRSTRTATILFSALDHLDAIGIPHHPGETRAGQLREVLTDAGYTPGPARL